MNREQALVIYTIMIFVLGMSFNWMIQDIQATGCPVDTIIPFIDDAIASFNSGEYAKALSQMQEAKNQLKDTFEVEE